MVTLRPFISYCHLKSQPFQSFRNGDKIENIWEDIKIFLESCTTTTREEPNYAELNIHEAYRASENKKIPKKIISEAKNLFGKGKFHPKTDNTPHHQYWEIDSKDLQKAIEFMVKGEPWPAFQFGAVLLYMTYYFKLVDPKTKTELENQQYQSFLIVFLSAKYFCTPYISFPFSEPNDEFNNYLSQIDSYLPFNLETKLLRLVKSNKQGTSNYSRKLFIDAPE